MQDEYLSAEVEEKGITDSDALPASSLNHKLILWRGDITTLKADAIVNAAKPVPLSGLYQSKPICPRHPGPLWEVIKRLAATSSTGISPPHGSHAAALIACDGIVLETLSRSDCD